MKFYCYSLILNSPGKIHIITICSLYLNFSPNRVFFSCSLKSFEKIQPILNICLASLSPLTLAEIYQSVNSAYTDNFLSWEEFVNRIDMVSQLLLERRDGKFVFFHPAFREWLSKRDGGQSTKFLADPK